MADYELDIRVGFLDELVSVEQTAAFEHVGSTCDSRRGIPRVSELPFFVSIQAPLSFPLTPPVTQHH